MCSKAKGAISRGRSGPHESTDGLEGAKVSLGHPVALESNVGVLYAAVLVADGYIGIIYALFVAVANIPAASLALAELATAEEEEAPLAAPLAEALFREPRIPPTIAPTKTTTATGIPNLIHLLVGFGFEASAGVM